MRPRMSPVGGKICRGRHLLPVLSGRTERGKARFYWVFRCGTALAEHVGVNVGRVARHCWSSVMLLALGAASSAMDALQALNSSKSSSANPRAPQGRANPFDLFCRCHGLGRPSRRRKRRFADFAGDHERAAGGAEPVLDRPIRANQPFGCAEAPVLADRRRWRRQDQQSRIRKRARRRRHQRRESRRRFSASSTRMATARSASTN